MRFWLNLLIVEVGWEFEDWDWLWSVEIVDIDWGSWECCVEMLVANLGVVWKGRRRRNDWCLKHCVFVLFCLVSLFFVSRIWSSYFLCLVFRFVSIRLRSICNSFILINEVYNTFCTIEFHLLDRKWCHDAAQRSTFMD